MTPEFSDAARVIIADSRLQAGMMRHPYVGTEHLALAMVASAEPTLRGMFSGRGITYDAALQLTTQLLGTPRPEYTTEQSVESRHFTERTMAVMDAARRECHEAGRACVTASDLVLGLFREGGGVGVEVLRRLGLDATHARIVLGERDAN